MKSLYRIWEMKWADEFDKLHEKYPGDKAEFNVTGDELLSDLRSWEWYADHNYVMP